MNTNLVLHKMKSIRLLLVQDNLYVYTKAQRKECMILLREFGIQERQ